ncbi:MAG: enolase C-terminal domain-like protein, partial [Candidatus Hodarchaeota archaeon]
VGEVEGDRAGLINFMKKWVLGHDPFQIEKLRWKLASPVYANELVGQDEIFAALEFAMLDIQGKILGRPVHDLVGGRMRDRINFSAYLFFRYVKAKGGPGGETTPEGIVEEARSLVSKYGFRTLKLKAGVYDPDVDLETIRLLRQEFPDKKIRIDPNAVWSPETAIRLGKKLEKYDIEYYEDPCSGIEGMAKVTRKVNIPTCTNIIVRTFRDLPAVIRLRAVDIIHSDPHRFGGIRAAVQLSKFCEVFNLGQSMHSGTEAGVGLAAMIHTAATWASQPYAIDTTYEHLEDDILERPFIIEDGQIEVPTRPGLGIEIDEKKLQIYAEAYKREGPFFSWEDPRQPEWHQVSPRW